MIVTYLTYSRLALTECIDLINMLSITTECDCGPHAVDVELNIVRSSVVEEFGERFRS